MQARLEQHKEKMAQWASQLPTGTRVAFGTSREQLFNLHTQGDTGPAACWLLWG